MRTNIEKLKKEALQKSILRHLSFIKEAKEQGERISPCFIPEAIAYFGMGGSGIPGHIASTLTQNISKTPFFVFQDYHVPFEYLPESTLFIACSYSGNTRETLHFLNALRNNVSDFHLKTVCISAGGMLSRIASENNIFLMNIPEKFLPRDALAHMLCALMVILAQFKIMEPNVLDEIESLAFNPGELSEIEEDAWKMAKVMALFLAENSSGGGCAVPVIYSSSRYQGIALRWKQQINENAKHMAFCNVIPEMHHNEIVAWDGKTGGIFRPIILAGPDEHPEVLRHIETTILLFRELNVPHLIYRVPENIPIIKAIFKLILVGDFCSHIIAALLGVDPSPTPNIDFIKKHLAGTG